ncbi:MAG: hypothetical protein ACM37W_28155 [Actinomycetota bacterium]
MDRLDNGKPKKDFRLVATIWIWVLSIFLLLACVPILALMENGLWLPLTVLIATALSTSSIWFFGKPFNLENDKKIKTLQTRIDNLEAILEIVDFDKKLINEDYKNKHFNRNI